MGGYKLPPSPPVWDLQKKLIPMGASIASSLGKDPQGVMKILSWIIRATFLDPQVARAAALDQKGTGTAVAAVALTAAPAAIISILGSGSVVANVMSLALTAVSLLIAAYLLSGLSQSMIGRKVPPGVLFRSIAYSLGANMLTFAPGIGPIVVLWSIPASTAAVREITAAETQKAVIFMVVWYLITVLSLIVIRPVLAPLLAIL